MNARKMITLRPQQVVDAHAAERPSDILPMDQPLDRFLDHMKTEHEQPIDKGLVDRGIDQWLGFVLFASAPLLR
jgi:hypothetical protein